MFDRRSKFDRSYFDRTRGAVSLPARIAGMFTVVNRTDPFTVTERTDPFIVDTRTTPFTVVAEV